jgi:hypothetical protein
VLLMKEYLVCDMCTATISTDESVCDFCGSDFKNNGSAAEILQFKVEIENKIYSSDINQLLDKIKKSKFKDHPIILFRKAKALLIDYMTNDRILEGYEFCEVIQIIDTISKVSEDYWKEFILYITVLFPTSHTKLFFDDFLQIRSLLESLNRDGDRIIENRLIQQIVISEVGDSFFKEYLFYLNDDNFINNSDFIKKKNFLIEKYDKKIKNIYKQLE